MKIIPRILQRTAIAFLILGHLSSQPFAAGLAFSGKEIALRWCVTCHVVAESQPNASTDAPAFSFIAAKYGDEIGVLEGFLADPHPVMPNMSLSRQEIRDLLAYIGSLN